MVRFPASTLLATVAVVLLAAASANEAAVDVRIVQDTKLILFSEYGEPPQCAVWLEDPASHAVRTIFVTHRAGQGDWEGKAECPAALPRWFEAYRRETGRTTFPRPESPAPDGVSGATCKTETFTCTASVPMDSRWICWIEVNLAADFNERFPELDEVTGAMDIDRDGQPSLLYRAEFAATPGESVVPELWGYTVRRGRSVDVCRDLSPITTAKDVFTSVEIRVASPASPDARQE